MLVVLLPHILLLSGSGDWWGGDNSGGGDWYGGGGFSKVQALVAGTQQYKLYTVLPVKLISRQCARYLDGGGCVDARAGALDERERVLRGEGTLHNALPSEVSLPEFA